jgi:hypothetical protein
MRKEIKAGDVVKLKCPTPQGVNCKMVVEETSSDYLSAHVCWFDAHAHLHRDVLRVAALIVCE